MGDGSVGGWKLAAPHDAQAQGLVVSAFPHLPQAQALLLTLPAGAGGTWLDAVQAVIPITPATGKTTPAASIGFTSSGLAVMGLDKGTLATFSTPFVEGMRQIDRQRRLGEENDDSTVIPGGPLWSGNAPDPFATPQAPATPTPTTIHAALLLYDEDDDKLKALAAKVKAALGPAGVVIARVLPLSLMFDDEGRAREHFGFVDGVSQPEPHGCAIVDRTGRPMPVDPWHAMAAGDILMGHINAHGEPAPGPLAPRPVEGQAGMISVDGLPTEQAPEGHGDLGQDGTYMVLRELRQDVKAFWDSMKAGAAALNTPGVTADWLAARVVGRTADGDPLCPAGLIPSDANGPANAFGFADNDLEGRGCPMGSHMRRANPRDGLAPTPVDGPDLLKAANNHRILRRGRKYGPHYVEDPKADRGLLFIALNTDIERQFEFIQQTWMLNPSFATLFDETDPLMGPKGRFTVPGVPIRLRPEVETFVQLAGGDYFFLPSLPALTYLARLPRATA
jgi:Dyp-type peroxidase family